MATMPRIGPGARNAHAQRHVFSSHSTGISQTVKTVSTNPAANCIVSAVPTYDWSLTSLAIVENCAESATTVKP